MGYGCPVCGTPQADARHLANHLAFTAMLHGEDHRAWLDEHVLDWETTGEEELADRVVDLAGDAEFPQVFEDTTDRTDAGHDHDDPPAERSGALFEGEDGPAAPADEGADGPRDPAVGPDGTGARDPEEMDAETRAVLDEARALTREMLAQKTDADAETDDGDDPTDEE